VTFIHWDAQKLGKPFVAASSGVVLSVLLIDLPLELKRPGGIRR
jgi:hypothetical protein